MHVAYEEYNGLFAKIAAREDILRYADLIPPVSSALVDVLNLLDDPDMDANELAKAISQDTRLTTALLKLAHSPAYPRRHGVLSVAQAITIVGANQIRALTLSTLLVGLAKRETVDLLIWENSLATAIIARRLAEEVGNSQPDEMFLMGLLHNLGQFIFLAHPQTRLAYGGVVRRIQETGVDYAAAELEEIGFSHNLVGALAANRWNLPSELCQNILHYTDPLEPIASPLQEKQLLVKMADLLAHASFIGNPPGYPVPLELIQQIANAVGIELGTNRGVVELIVLARNAYEGAVDLRSALTPFGHG